MGIEAIDIASGLCHHEHMDKQTPAPLNPPGEPIRQNRGGEPPLLQCGSPKRPVLCPESGYTDSEPFQFQGDGVCPIEAVATFDEFCDALLREVTS